MSTTDSWVNKEGGAGAEGGIVVDKVGSDSVCVGVCVVRYRMDDARNR